MRKLYRLAIASIAFMLLCTSPVIPTSAQQAGDDGSENDDAGDRRETDRGDDSDDVFIPTEEIPADEEVTFPVDI